MKFDHVYYFTWLTAWYSFHVIDKAHISSSVSSFFRAKLWNCVMWLILDLLVPLDVWIISSFFFSFLSTGSSTDFDQVLFPLLRGQVGLDFQTWQEHKLLNKSTAESKKNILFLMFCLLDCDLKHQSANSSLRIPLSWRFYGQICILMSELVYIWILFLIWQNLGRIIKCFTFQGLNLSLNADAILVTA